MYSFLWLETFYPPFYLFKAFHYSPDFLSLHPIYFFYNSVILYLICSIVFLTRKEMQQSLSRSVIQQYMYPVTNTLHVLNQYVLNEGTNKWMDT